MGPAHMVMLSPEADQRHLQGQCRRLGLSDEGDVDDLLDRVQQHVQRMPILEGCAPHPFVGGPPLALASGAHDC